MPINRGKAFEGQFKKDWLRMKNSTCDRLPDIMSGYKAMSGICDFITYKFPLIFYMECKVIEKGNTFALTRLTQYDKLITKANIPGVRAGAVLWFTEKDKVVFVPITTFKKLIADGAKSFNIKYLETGEYEAIDIPSVKKVTFMDSDYSILCKPTEEELEMFKV